MKDDKVYLEHIIDSLKKILNYAEDLSLDAFLNYTKTQDACIRQLEVIGEATKQLSKPLRQRFMRAPWKDMAGMRDKLIHDYIQVDLLIVWITVSEEATPLLIDIEQVYNTLLIESNNTTN
ncbi:HepT-like ribonuclease domain-containing protein [Spirosoma validum]|uniref:DUF86 domain-containing protein n=1 Tax=Spirosoma validum TaxID=2771355 RepID=A0A927GGK4_9BACT|nr:DUF86 domain-containing protein [Spirosoma validum]MBD2756971.1 DUF86 domain-containing protein [Spirosoma validum]